LGRAEHALGAAEGAGRAPRLLLVGQLGRALRASDGVGNKRVLGRHGASSGYFLSPSGMYIEVIHRELRDHLAGWLSKPKAER
jgi:hypothetical protein